MKGYGLYSPSTAPARYALKALFTFSPNFRLTSRKPKPCTGWRPSTVSYAPLGRHLEPLERCVCRTDPYHPQSAWMLSGGWTPG